MALDYSTHQQWLHNYALLTLLDRLKINYLTLRNRNVIPTVIFSIRGRLVSIITIFELIIKLTGMLSSSNVRTCMLLFALRPKIFRHQEHSTSDASCEWQSDWGKVRKLAMRMTTVTENPQVAFPSAFPQTHCSRRREDVTLIFHIRPPASLKVATASAFPWTSCKWCG
jgi:hypothetical protein